MTQKKDVNYITKLGMSALRAEYSELLNVERPKMVETVAWAASNGDRSENGDYIYGKRRLREIDRRLRFLQKRIEAAQVVEHSNKSKLEKVVFASRVEVEDEDGQKKIYEIVGEDEFEAGAGRISWKSPMGQSLLGKKVGEEVLVKRPVGDIYLEIKKIEPIQQ